MYISNTRLLCLQPKFFIAFIVKLHIHILLASENTGVTATNTDPKKCTCSVIVYSVQSVPLTIDKDIQTGMRLPVTCSFSPCMVAPPYHLFLLTSSMSHHCDLLRNLV